VKPSEAADKAMTASANPAHARLVEIDAADYDLSDTGWRRQTLKCLIRDEARVDVAEGIGKSLQQSLQSADDLGEVFQRATAAQLARVMDDDLDAKHAFAFAVNLQSQGTTVQLEDRQIIGRSLDRDFPIWCAFFARAIFWTALASNDCLYSLQVQPHAASVNQSLKDLFHVAANLEDEVAAVLISIW
jgi:hypothetical protein